MGRIEDWNKQDDITPSLRNFNPAQSNTNAVSTMPAPQQGGGIGDFLKSFAKGIIEPASYLINTDIVNPWKETAATVTGNHVALRNAKKESHREIGLGDKGDNIGGALKKWGGNSAQFAAMMLAPEAKSFMGSVGVGAGTGAIAGGGSALASSPDSSLKDVLLGSVLGAGTGAAFAGGGKVIGKLFGKGATGAERLEARAAGLGVGEKAAGRQLGVEDSNKLLQVLKDEKISAGHPESRLAQVESKLNDYGSQISNTVKGIDRPLTSTEKQGIASQYLKGLSGDISNDATVMRYATPLSERMKGINTLDEAITQKRNLQSEINYNRNGANPIPGKEKALRGAVSALDEFISGVSPELKNLNTRYSGLSSASDYLKNASGRLSKSSESGGGSVVGKVLSGDTAQSVKSIAGSAGNKVLGLADKSTPRSFIGNLLRQDAASAAGSLAAPTSNPDMQTSDQSSSQQPQFDQFLKGTVLDPTIQSESSSIGSGENSSNPFSPSNVEANVQKIVSQGGKMKDVAEYISTVKAMQEVVSPQSKGLNSTAAGTVTDLQNGIANIGALSNEFASNKSNMPFIGGLLAKVPGNTSAQGLQADVSRVKQVIGKALEGGVLRKEDEEKYAKILPTVNDTDAVAQYKISQIKSDLERKLALYQQNLGGGSGGAELSNISPQAY